MKTPNRKLGSLIALSFSLLSPACEIPQSTIEAALQGNTGKAARNGTPSGCRVQTFRQPLQTSKLDLLFVTDTSGSLSTEREEIADGIDHFIRALPKENDVRVAVMLGHSPLSPYSGRLWRSDGGLLRGSSEPWALSTLDSPRGYVRAKLKHKLRRQASELQSDGGEMGLGSLLLALDRRRIAESRDKGFFRKDSALAVIFVSDENDICADHPSGRNRVPDPQGIELIAKRRFCTPAAGITPENILTQLQQIQDGRPLVIGGMIYSNPSRVPRGSENEVGYGYLDTIQLAGPNGLVIDLADGHLDEGLGRLGEFTSRRLELQESFPIDSAATSHLVRVDGRQVDYRISGNELFPAERGREGSVIEIVSCTGPGSIECLRARYDWNGRSPNRNADVPGIPLLAGGTNFAADRATSEQLCRAATGPAGKMVSHSARSWVSPHDNVVVRWDGREFQRYNGTTYNRWLDGLSCSCVSTPVVEPTPVVTETPVVEPTPSPTETPVVEPTPEPTPTQTENPWDVGIGI